MRRVYKLLVIILCAAVLFSAFAACSKTPSPAPDTGNDQTKGNANITEATKSNEKVSLDYAFWGSKEEVATRQKVIDSYTELNPNVTINQTYTDGGSYPTKLQTLFAANTAPDVIQLASDISVDFAKKGLFADLSAQAADLQSLWNPAILKAFNINDQQYALPYDFNTYLIIYNKKIFDEAQVPYPTADWTEEQFMDIAKKLTKGSDVNKIYGMYWNWQAGEMKLNLYNEYPAYDVENNKITVQGNEAFKHTLELLNDTINVSKVATDESAVRAVGGGFETGKFAMAMAGPWDMTGFETTIGTSFDWDVVKLPRSEKYGNWHCGQRVDGMALSKDTKKAEQAFDFIKWFCTDIDTIKALTETSLPCLSSYVNEEYLTDFPAEWPVKYNKQAFMDMQEYTAPLYWMGIWGKVNEELGKQHETYMMGQISLDEALTNMQVNGQKILDNQ